MRADFLISTVVILTITAGCSENSPVNIENNESVQVTLMSTFDAELPIHILAPGEAFDPSNQLPPGQDRSVLVVMADFDDVPFRAGRNGTVIVETECHVEFNVIDEPPINPRVIWNGEALSCLGWISSDP